MIVLLISNKVTFVDIIIFFCVSYISNKTLILIGEYMKYRREKQHLELIIKRLEDKLCQQNIQLLAIYQ